MSSFFQNILIRILHDKPSPLWSDYTCGLYIFRHWQSLHDEDVTLKSLLSIYHDVVDQCIQQGVFLPDKDLPTTLFRIQAKHSTNPEEVLCAADPFAYISHLSAMVYHGLTNRLPTTLVYTTLPEPQWRSEARVLMENDLGEDLPLYLQSRLPRLTSPSLQNVQGMHLQKLGSNDRGSYRHTRDSALRVAKIGRTFLDMLQQPRSCGGIHHVLEVYEDHAERHLTSIIDAIELHGRKIDKVRAGYVLEELCGIENERVASWVSFARRGGGQKLDPNEDYSPDYSERWMLSINV